MKDLIGNEVVLGDQVVTGILRGRSWDLRLGTVTEIRDDGHVTVSSELPVDWFRKVPKATKVIRRNVDVVKVVLPG